MRTKHLGTRGLVCFSNGLKVFPDDNEGLLWVNRDLPLAVFPVEVVIMLLFPQSLQVHVENNSVIDHAQTWTKVKSGTMEEN